ncbi:MAG: hypothetical protein IJX28_08660 [Clostridia bacterium]|nr:hypothetical protein [Clostridia bacterium]
MTKFFGFLIWWGAMIGAVVLACFYFTEVEEAIGRLVLICALFLLCGIGRRIFHIKPAAKEKYGVWKCIVKRIFCRRFYISIFLYAAVCAILYGVVQFMQDNLVGVLIAIGGFIVLTFARAIVAYTCAHCGNRLVMDGRNYDDELIIEHSSSSSTASRYSTDYLHCPKCGKKSRIRIKHTAAKINY